jgi:hypothetical protein
MNIGVAVRNIPLILMRECSLLIAGKFCGQATMGQSYLEYLFFALFRLGQLNLLLILLSNKIASTQNLS